MRIMSKLLTRGAALALGLLLPAMTLATSYDYNDYNYDYYNNYDYNYDSGASAALGIGLMIFLGIVALVALVFFVFEIWMIIDCIKRDFENRTVWLVVLIAGLFFGFGWIAAIIYFFAIKHKHVGKMHQGGHSTAGSNMGGNNSTTTTPSEPMQK
jgi:hypothetical protein